MSKPCPVKSGGNRGQESQRKLVDGELVAFKSRRVCGVDQAPFNKLSPTGRPRRRAACYEFDVGVCLSAGQSDGQTCKVVIRKC